MMFRAFAAEFPNDNEALHMGTIWRNESPCGQPQAFKPALEEDPTDMGEPIEIVDTIELGEPVEVVPAPAASEVVLSSAYAERIAAEMAIPSAPRVPTFDAIELIEAHAEASQTGDGIEGLIEEGETLDAPAPPRASADAYETFLRTLSDVALEVGVPIAVATLELSLGADPTATAWRAILRNESEDFSMCAATLDEWASVTLAALISAPSKAAQIRRELRARGVAAFGLVVEAA